MIEPKEENLLQRLWKQFTPLIPAPRRVSTDAERAVWANYLQNDPDAKIGTTRVTELLLREAKYLIDSRTAAIRATERKAASQVAILGGGLGIVSVLGVTQTAFAISGSGWVVILALVLLVIAALFDLACIALPARDLPHIDIFNSRDIVGDSQMEGPVGSSMVEGYLMYAGELFSLSRGKTNLQIIATVVFGLGVIILASNLVWADTHPHLISGALESANCRFTDHTVTCKVPHK